MRGLVAAGGLPYRYVGPVQSFDPSALQRVLSRVEQRRESGGGLVIFDLDSTLLDNRPRQARIVRDWGARAGHAQLAACGPEHFAGWSLRVPLRECGFSEEEAAALEPELRRFWRRHFFTSEYCVSDIAIAGAVAFVEQVRSRGAQVVYCTGRPQKMWDGTVSCFVRQGLPPPDGSAIHLLMKPSSDLHDDDFKRRAREQIAALGEVLAAFDNEPAHINIYRDCFPEALCVHLATDESLRPIPLREQIPSIQSFVLP